MSSAWMRSARLPILHGTWTCAEVCLGAALAVPILDAYPVASNVWRDLVLYLAVPFSILAAVVALPIEFRRNASPPAQQNLGPDRSCNRDARLLLFGYSVFFGIASTSVSLLGGQAVAGLCRAGAFSFPLILFSTLTGLLVGVLVAGLQSHRDRRVGLVPIAAAGLTASLAWVSTEPNLYMSLLVVAFVGGVLLFPLRSAFVEVDANQRGSGTWLSAVACAGSSIGAAVLSLFAQSQRLELRGYFLTLAVAAGSASVASGLLLFRQVLELLAEFALWPIYRIRAVGNGLEHFPVHGPVLVVANHSAWMDPLWLGKVLPRLITPMMTSVFYDLPILRWLMLHVVRAIRVEASTYRREAPELQQAIAALDRGECVLIFPEGWMRRHTRHLIRPFAQGPWHILRERPQTPVVVCWIEGGWGSFFSYFGGHPTKNKRFDWWRSIRISVEEPQIVDPAILKDLWATRNYLMHACLNARRHLDLHVPAISQAEFDEASEIPQQEPLAKSA